MNDRVFKAINSGVCAAGFAASQSAYDQTVAGVFDMLGELDDLLAHRRYMIGDTLIEADWRLFTSMVRFDAVYHGHFKCNRSRLIDYTNMTGWLR